MKEESKAVASKFALSYWSILLLLSTILIALIEDVFATLIWVVFTALLGSTALWYRSRLFLRTSHELLSKGQVSNPYDMRRQHRLLVLLMFLTVIAFFAPLFLSAELNSSVWFGSLLGVLDGWILGLLLYNVFLLNWQNTHLGDLFVLEKWNGHKVTHLGLTFSKRSDLD